MPTMGAANVESFGRPVSTEMSWANRVRVIANDIGVCVGNASNSRFGPLLSVRHQEGRQLAPSRSG